MISTHALTEGDYDARTDAIWSAISTHALTEGDQKNAIVLQKVSNFNSRPHGGRPVPDRPFPLLLHISTHALTEGDHKILELPNTDGISTHALTEGDSNGQCAA